MSEALDALPQVVFETAAEHLTARVPIAAPTAQAGDIRRSLEGNAFDTVAEIAICEDGKLVGLLNIEDVLPAPATTLASQIMDPDPPVVAPGLDQEMAAWKAVQRGESSLAVVDAGGRFLGLIPPSRLLAILLSEHDEDMARLGGFLHDTASARTAGQEAMPRRIVHRLPWLLLGLAGAFLAADIVGRFEEQLQGRVILAFFLPGVVYLADAVGTQTEALVIRGLSVGVPIGDVVVREVLTGLLIGLALALAFVPVALWRWGQPDIVLAVALSLLAACSIATVIATSLPWLLQRLGLDPAFGSGPLATVIQDLLSILLYFLISVAILAEGT
jgi:magnesium transporter